MFQKKSESSCAVLRSMLRRICTTGQIGAWSNSPIVLRVRVTRITKLLHHLSFGVMLQNSILCVTHLKDVFVFLQNGCSADGVDCLSSIWMRVRCFLQTAILIE